MTFNPDHPIHEIQILRMSTLLGQEFNEACPVCGVTLVQDNSIHQREKVINHLSAEEIKIMLQISCNTVEDLVRFMNTEVDMDVWVAVRNSPEDKQIVMDELFGKDCLADTSACVGFVRQLTSKNMLCMKDVLTHIQSKNDCRTTGVTSVA